MLESTFIILVAMGFCFFILGIEKIATMKGMIYEGISMGFWFVCWAAALYIEVPSDTSYFEQSFGYICMGLGLINIIIFILSIIMYQFNKKEREEEDKMNTVVSMYDQEEYYE